MPKARTPRATKAKTEKKVLQMPDTNGNSAYPSAAQLEAEIRLTAYLLYEKRGCVNGLAEEDWFTAEREVLSRYHVPKQEQTA